MKIMYLGHLIGKDGVEDLHLLSFGCTETIEFTRGSGITNKSLRT